jgi:Cell division protein
VNGKAVQIIMNNAFGYSFRQAIKQTGRNRTMMVTSLFSITAMMLILGLFFILVVNVNTMTASIRNEFNVIEIFLLDEAENAEIYTMIGDIGKLDYVDDVSYISKEQALEEMKQSWDDKSYLLEGFNQNPLPRSLRVTMNDMEQAEALIDYIGKYSAVEDVKYGQTEVEKILKITNGIQIGALVLIMFLIIVSVVVVSNTIKLTVLARGQEIGIMKYVGATNWFVRGPFLIEGILIGIVAAIISAVLTTALYSVIVSNLGDRVLILFSTNFVPVGYLSGNLIVIFLALGISIGAIGSLISMRRFLEV